jgi:UrcA family protein
MQKRMLQSSGERSAGWFDPQTELTGRCEMKRKHNVSEAALLMGAMVLSVSAWAAPPMDTIVTQVETVKYARMPAETSAGAVKLYGALQAAAWRVCRAPGMRPSMMGTSYQACADAALAKAVGDVNIDAVSAIYLQNTQLPEKKGIVTVAKR